MNKKQHTQRSAARTVTQRFWRRRVGSKPGWWPGGLIPALGLIVTFIYGFIDTAPAIETQTADQVERALSRQGLRHFKVLADGQEVLVRVSAGDADPDLVLAWAQNTLCDTWVAGEQICPNSVAVELSGDSLVPMASEPQPHNFSFIETEASLRLSGHVPSDVVRQQILAAAERLHSQVADELVVTGKIVADSFDWAVDKSWPLIALLDDAQVHWKDGSFSASGNATGTQLTSARLVFSNVAYPDRLGSLNVQSVVSASSCNESFAAALSESKIEFSTASAEISTNSRDLIEELANLASACPMQLTIAGHTDNVGPATINDFLSQARAEAVASVFVDLGINSSRLTARGFGSDRPVADNSSNSGRARNRRIEITVSE